MIRVVFFGTPDVAVPSLEALVAAPDMDVVAVVTNPDRPRGRSRRPRPSPVKEAAVAAGIDVWQPRRGRDVVDQLAAVAPDVCAVVAYGSLLPRVVLDVPTHGFVNLHFSLLPRWRGAAPVQHAIRAGDTVTGVTTFVLDEGMDTGPVLSTTTTPIGRDETAGQLLARLAVAGAPVLVAALRDLVAGAEPTPQPDEGVTLAPKITPDDVAIDFTRPATEVAALVRSAAPRPGAHTTWRGDRFKVLGAVASETVAGRSVADVVADLAAAGTEVEPGTILAATADGLAVACGDGAVVATRVQPAGKAAMDAAAFANGYQPEPGERLGS
jgi:methionyl-tRNA formyltransferase